MVDLIIKKRNGQELSKEEIDFIINGYTEGEISDYQMAAWAMAVYFQDMTTEERAHLTMAMMKSGEQVDLSSIEGIKVDKHSTGGVGDTTTLVLAPLVASLGVPVAKMSGRGLGHTGGTIDKLESIPGFQVEIDNKSFLELVNKYKVAVVGQTGNLAPADKKLYGLRDVTGTVESIPLIASSIMSKKLASGADAIVLDVKTGSGAFMKDLEQAEELAQAMVDIGNNVGRKTIAIISDMSQPLGRAIGNALEIIEAIETLKGRGPSDLTELCLKLGSYMLYLAGKITTPEEGERQIKRAIDNGQALQTFQDFIQAQGGDSTIVHDYSKLPTAKFKIPVLASAEGFVAKIQAQEIGTAAMLLGAGRATKEDEIDLAVGVVLKKKIGDKVEKGEPLAIIYSNKEDISASKEKIQQAFTIAEKKIKAPTLIHKVIS